MKVEKMHPGIMGLAKSRYPYSFEFTNKVTNRSKVLRRYKRNKFNYTYF